MFPLATEKKNTCCFMAKIFAIHFVLFILFPKETSTILCFYNGACGNNQQNFSYELDMPVAFEMLYNMMVER